MNRTEMDRMMAAVSKAQERLGGSPPVAQALEPALKVGYFLCLGLGDDFDQYLAAFRDPALPVSGTFACDEDFVAWALAQREAGRVPRGIVEVAGTRCTIGYSRAKGDVQLLRLPSVEDVRRPLMGEQQEWLWNALDRAYEVLRDSAEDVEGLHCAALALRFLHESGCTSEYVWFLEHSDEELVPVCVFNTMEDAEDWLERHPSPPSGAPVHVGAQEYMVGYWPTSRERALLRIMPLRQVMNLVPREGGGGGRLMH
jgi:hypothetical protein